MELYELNKTFQQYSIITPKHTFGKKNNEKSFVHWTVGRHSSFFFFARKRNKSRFLSSCQMDLTSILGQKFFFHENPATYVMCHVETICEISVDKAFEHLFQKNDMTPICNFVIRRHLLFPKMSSIPDVEWFSCAHSNGSQSFYEIFSSEKSKRVFFQDVSWILRYFLHYSSYDTEKMFVLLTFFGSLIFFAK